MLNRVLITMIQAPFGIVWTLVGAATPFSTSSLTRPHAWSHGASGLPFGQGSADTRAGSKTVRRPTRRILLLSAQLPAGVGGDRRRGPSVDGADDCAAVDALQVDGAPRGAMRKEMTDDIHLIRAGWNAGPGLLQRPGEAGDG